MFSHQDFLLNSRMFDLDPSIMSALGLLDAGDFVSFRATLSVHGRRITKMLTAILGLLGPDTQVLEDFVDELAGRRGKVLVSPGSFDVLRRAVTLAMADILGNVWTDRARDAWDELLDEVSRLLATYRCLRRLSNQQFESPFADSFTLVH